MSKSVIATLPLNEVDRGAFIRCANESFERVLDRMEPENPRGTRKLWNAGAYVDTVLKEDMLPIERDFALSLIEGFLVHHVADLAAQADDYTTT